MIDELDRAIAEALDEIVSRAPELGPPPSDVLFTLDERRGRRPVLVAAIAVAAAGVLAVGATVVIRSRTETDPVPATQPPPPPAMTDWYIPDELPDGMALYEGYGAGKLTSFSGPILVFGAEDTDPASGPSVLVQAFRGGEAYCGTEYAPVTVDLDGMSAEMCRMPHSTHLIWNTPDRSVLVQAAPSVADDELVRLARALVPDLDLDAEPASAEGLPSGWVLLSDYDELVAAGASDLHYEVGAIAQSGVGPGFIVSIRTGVPDSALMLWSAPFEADEVRFEDGRVAYAYREPLGPGVFWVEQHGVVIFIQSDGADRDGIMRFAESLQRADEKELESFLAGATAPPDQGLMVGTTTSSSTTTVPGR